MILYHHHYRARTHRVQNKAKPQRLAKNKRSNERKTINKIIKIWCVFTSLTHTHPNSPIFKHKRYTKPLLTEIDHRLPQKPQYNIYIHPKQTRTTQGILCLEMGGKHHQQTGRDMWFYQVLTYDFKKENDGNVHGIYASRCNSANLTSWILATYRRQSIRLWWKFCVYLLNVWPTLYIYV